MKTLVLGGLGYFGHILVNELVKQGHEVTVLDNLMYKQRPEVFGSEIRFILGDIRHEEQVRKAMKEQEIVMDLAAIVGDQACALNEEETITTNLNSTRLLLAEAEEAGVQRFIYASTCSVYGCSTAYTLNEGSLVTPLSLYARCKIESEKILLCGARRVTPIILRLSTLFGLSPRMRFDLVVNFMCAVAYYKKKILVEGGRQWRPLLHLQDAADAFILMMDASESKVRGEIFNVGSPKNNLKIEDLAEMIAIQQQGVMVTRQHKNDKRDYKVDFTKITELLKYSPKFHVIDGVKEILGSIDQYPDYENNKYYNVKYAFKN